MPGHTALLPGVTNLATTADPDKRLTFHTFFEFEANHWLLPVGDGQERFECDDHYIASPAFATLHQIWVR